MNSLWLSLSLAPFPQHLVDVSDFFFSARGGGRGSPRRREGAGGRFFIENSRRGGVPGGEGPRGQEGVCSEFGNSGGGG